MAELDSEYGVKFKHLAGLLNTRADGLSRYKILEETPDGALKQLYKVSALDRDADDAYPVSVHAIQEAQGKSDKLRKEITSEKGIIFGSKDFNGIKVVTYKDKIWIPLDLQSRVVNWYQNNLDHTGRDRTYNSIMVTSNWKGLQKMTNGYIRTCDIYQKHKTGGRRNHGLIPLTGALRDKKP